MHYALRHANGMVDIAFENGRLVVQTKGVGALDKLKVIDISVSALQAFCVVPTIGAQALIGRVDAVHMAYDTSFDSEFIFSFMEGAKKKSKRVFVNGQNPAFAEIRNELLRARPDASLLHLPPAEAQKQIGVISGRQGVFILIAAVLGIPLIIIAIVVIASVMSK